MYIPETPCKGYRFALSNLSDPLRLKVLGTIHAERLEAISFNRILRLSWLQQVEANQEHGMIRLITWQRDCDCCEGWSSTVLRVEDLDKAMDRQLDGAEGPMHFHLGKPSVIRALPRSRDRVMEAFEDGHPWSV